MLVTRKHLRKYLFEALSGMGYVNAAISQGKLSNSLTADQRKLIANDAETQQLISLLGKRDQLAAGHAATVRHAMEIGDTQMVVLANSLEGWIRPSSSAGTPLAGALNITNLSGGGEVYAFQSDAGFLSPMANANDNYQAAGGSSFNGFAFGQRCLTTSTATGFPWPSNPGERMEVAMAALFACWLPRITFGSRMDHAPGRDLEVLDGWRGPQLPRFEVKFTEGDDDIPQTMFGASPPTRTATDKYFIFLSGERSYLIHSPTMAGLLETDPEDMPTDATQAQNAILGAALVKNLLDWPQLKTEFVNIVKSYSQPRLESGDSGIIEDLLNAVIDGINGHPNREQLIFTIARAIAFDRTRAVVGSIQSERASRAGGSRSFTQDQREHILDWYDSYTRGTGGPSMFGINSNAPASLSMNPPKDTRLVNASDFGLVRGTPGRADTNTYEYMQKLILTLCNKFELQQSVDVIIPAANSFIEKATGISVNERGTTGTTTGRNIDSYLLDDVPTPTIKANLIFNTVNNDAIPDSIKNRILGQLKHDPRQASGDPNKTNFRDLSRMGHVLRSIQNDSNALGKSLKEIMRSREGRNKIFSEYMLDAADIARNISNQIKTNTSKQKIDTMKAIDKATGLYRAAGETIPDIPITDKEIGKEIGKRIGNINYNTIRDIMSEGNEWWTSFDREDYWSGPDNWDQQLFTLLFETSVSSHKTLASITFTPKSKNQVKNEIRNLLQTNSTLSSFYNEVNLALTAYQNAVIQKITDTSTLFNKPEEDLRATIGQKLDSSTLSNIEDDYKNSLSPTELNLFNSKNRLEQIGMMKSAGVISDIQEKNLTRKHLKEERLKQSAGGYGNIDENKISNSKIYQKILKELLEYLK